MTTVPGRRDCSPAPLLADGTAGPLPAYAIALLEPDEWRALRDLRLAALQDAPGEFLARYDVELTYREDHYRLELSRDDWIACRTPEGTGLAILRIDEVPDAEGPGIGRRHLGHMWVRPEYRGTGMGREMVNAALRHLAGDPRCEFAYLYVFTANERARKLYDGLGFEPVGEPEPLPDDSGRYEQLMRIRLGDGAAAVRRGQAR
jgi:ribosomal protein S18 acetylase RimI-like enzyme